MAFFGSFAALEKKHPKRVASAENMWHLYSASKDTEKRFGGVFFLLLFGSFHFLIAFALILFLCVDVTAFAAVITTIIFLRWIYFFMAHIYLYINSLNRGIHYRIQSHRMNVVHRKQGRMYGYFKLKYILRWVCVCLCFMYLFFFWSTEVF